MGILEGRGAAGSIRDKNALQPRTHVTLATVLAHYQYYFVGNWTPETISLDGQPNTSEAIHKPKARDLDSSCPALICGQVKQKLFSYHGNGRLNKQ